MLSMFFPDVRLKQYLESRPADSLPVELVLGYVALVRGIFYRKEILDELAEEEIATGHMIVYTSADSVLQICGNEETFDLQNLYRCCEIAREL